GDQEHRIGPPGARLLHLVGIDQEILPETGERSGRARLGQMIEGTAEEALVGQDRERRGAGGGVAARERGDVVVGADGAARRRGALQLGDHPARCLPGERRTQAAPGHRIQRPVAERLHRDVPTPALDLRPLVGDDRVEHAHQAAPASAWRRPNSTTASSTRAAAPESMAADASPTPARRSRAAPATTRAAAALRQTTSRAGPDAPPSTARSSTAASAVDPILSAAAGAGTSPASAAVTVPRFTLPCAIS